MNMRNERGATAVEYALLIFMVSIFCIGAIVFRDAIRAVFDEQACDEKDGYSCTK
jgi:Flp pilus assembly pilin Flp